MRMTEEDVRIVNRVLIDAWDDAEDHAEEKKAEAIRRAIDDLDMAYVLPEEEAGTVRG